MCLTEEELKVIEQKELQPHKTVLCPRCHKELIFRSVGNSYEIKCQTDGCIKYSVRGL